MKDISNKFKKLYISNVYVACVLFVAILLIAFFLIGLNLYEGLKYFNSYQEFIIQSIITVAASLTVLFILLALFLLINKRNKTQGLITGASIFLILTLGLLSIRVIINNNEGKRMNYAQAEVTTLLLTDNNGDDFSKEYLDKRIYGRYTPALVNFVDFFTKANTNLTSLYEKISVLDMDSYSSFGNYYDSAEAVLNKREQINKYYMVIDQYANLQEAITKDFQQKTSQLNLPDSFNKATENFYTKAFSNISEPYVSYGNSLNKIKDALTKLYTFIQDTKYLKTNNGPAFNSEKDLEDFNNLVGEINKTIDASNELKINLFSKMASS
ncbi:MAG TPA: hypothetical protein VIK72_14810 [Clostridiaceae bacterium]